MIKKDYQKPTMKVVPLKHRTHILVGSGPKTMSGPSDEEWYELE